MSAAFHRVPTVPRTIEMALDGLVTQLIPHCNLNIEVGVTLQRYHLWAGAFLQQRKPVKTLFQTCFRRDTY